MSKIVVIGSLIVDITAFAPHLPVMGETSLGTVLKMGPGGKGNNQATAASRSGAEVIMISKWGTDPLQSILSDHYKNEGMSTRFIGTDSESETGSAFIEVDENGQNRIIVIKGANDKITRDEVLAAEEDFKTCDLVLSQLETSIESIVTAKELARKYGKTYLLNPAPFQTIPDGLFEGIDYLTPNETEAEFFTGIPVTDKESADKAAKVLFDKGVKNVIITLGKQGVYYNTSKESGIIPTTNLKPVDTTGAGDAFNGGFAAAISEGKDIVTALKFGNCVASIEVTRKGTAPAMPYRSESLKLLKDFYGIDY